MAQQTTRQTIKQVQNGVIGPVLSKVPSSVRDFLAPIINLGDEGVYYEPTCPFCTCALRMRAEAYYNSLDRMRTQRKENLQRWLLEKGENLPFDVIRNHISNHMDRGDNEFRKIEYLNKISNLTTVNMGALDRLKLALAAIEERVTTIAACGSEGSKMSIIALEEKKSRTINDLMKTYSKLIELHAGMIKSMQKQGDIFSISKGDFEKAFEKALQLVSSNEARNVISELLDDLENASSSLPEK